MMTDQLRKRLQSAEGANGDLIPLSAAISIIREILCSSPPSDPLAGSGGPTRLLRFADLRERGLVRNWVTLRRWIQHEDFPPGRRLANNSRAWTEKEVEEWLDSRPAATGEELD